MNRILFGNNYLVSRLPLRILYIFSDIMFFLNFYVIKYRKKVVYENLKKAFPEKSEQEIYEIQREFFINFSDYIVEMLKAVSMSEKELKIRVQHINQDLFYQVKEEKKNTILLAGHIFNWEWMNALAAIIPQENCSPVYRKINNVFWEEVVKGIRNRFGNKSLTSDEVLRHILRTPIDGNSIYMFIADQSPFREDVNYGLNFLNQKTPVFIGYDKISQKLDFAFIYCEMKKVKRGYYQVNYHRILPDDDKFKEYEVVRKFHKMLENTINKRPGNWLWSHKRWKNQERIKKYEP